MRAVWLSRHFRRHSLPLGVAIARNWRLNTTKLPTTSRTSSTSVRLLFLKRAKALLTNAAKVSVDCDADANKPLCGEMGIQGFPTLKIFPGGYAPPQGPLPMPFLVRLYSHANPTDFGGAREAKAIIEHAISRMPMFVKKLMSASDVSALRNKVGLGFTRLACCN